MTRQKATTGQTDSAFGLGWRICHAFFCLFILLHNHFLLSAYALEGKRSVDWNGEVILINAGMNKAVQVNFPLVIQEVIKATESLDVQIREKSVFLKILSADLTDTQIFVSAQGVTYPVLLKISQQNNDFVVDIRDMRQIIAQKIQEEQHLTKDIDPVTLMVAMASDEALAGFSVLSPDRPLNRFNRNGMLEARMKKIYESSFFSGFVVEIKNKSVLPLVISEKDFIGPNVIAVSFERESGFLAPAPQDAEDTVSGQFKMLVFLVVVPGGL